MARYRDAIEWIAHNDDTEWAENDPDEACGTTSVTAALVADLFGKDDQQVRKDVRAALKRAGLLNRSRG